MKDLLDHIGNSANIIVLDSPLRTDKKLSGDDSIWWLEDCQSGSAKIGSIRKAIRKPNSQAFIDDLRNIETVFIHDSGFSDARQRNVVEIHIKSRSR
jgi:hypothetical protein